MKSYYTLNAGSQYEQFPADEVEARVRAHQIPKGRPELERGDGILDVNRFCSHIVTSNSAANLHRNWAA